MRRETNENAGLDLHLQVWTCTGRLPINSEISSAVLKPINHSDKGDEFSAACSGPLIMGNGGDDLDLFIFCLVSESKALSIQWYNFFFFFLFDAF